MYTFIKNVSNPLTDIKSTNCMTIDSVLLQATAAAIVAGRTTQIRFTCAKAWDGADAQNYAIQTTVRIKKGVANGVTLLLGSSITNRVLKNIDDPQTLSTNSLSTKSSKPFVKEPIISPTKMCSTSSSKIFLSI